MKKNKLSLEEWQVIGNKAKDVRRGLLELLTMLGTSLPKTKYLDKWEKAEKAYDKLRSHLDDIVCGELINEPDNVVTHIFYGDNDK